jgi:hypothetical protein
MPQQLWAGLCSILAAFLNLVSSFSKARQFLLWFSLSTGMPHPLKITPYLPDMTATKLEKLMTPVHGRWLSTSIGGDMTAPSRLPVMRDGMGW